MRTARSGGLRAAGATPPSGANAVTLDGTYLTRGAQLTGTSDSKLWTGAIVFRFHTLPGGDVYLLNSTNSRYNVLLQSTGSFRIWRRNAVNTNADRLFTSNLSINTWYKILWSVELHATDLSLRHMYVNDVSDLIQSAYNNVEPDHTEPETAIGSLVGGTQPFPGDIAMLWLEFGRYVDFSVEVDRRRFFAANGDLVSLGADGSTPFGSAPHIFLAGPTASFHTNRGGGGGFTVNNGPLVTASAPLPGGSAV